MVEDLGHCEHVYSVLFKDGSHEIVASDLPAISGILEVVFADILPHFLHGLGSGKLEGYWDDWVNISG